MRWSDRAVAITCHPLAWNSRASVLPMEPTEQPVIRTTSFAEFVIDSQGIS